MKIENLIPYHLPYEEILLSIASSVIFKELELLNLPKISLSEVIEKPQYGYTTSASSEPVGVKLVRITDIQAGKINWDSVPYCEFEHPEKYLLRENDILFARTGGTTGKSFIVKGDIPNSIFASYLIRVRPKQGTNSDFLYWFFQTKQYWSQIVTEKKGSAQPNVNGKKLSSLDIFVPESSIQEGIAEYLNSYRSKVYGDSFELPSLIGILKNAEEKVRRIGRFMASIEEARRLRAEAVKEVGETVENTHNQIFMELSQNFGTVQIQHTELDINPENINPKREFGENPFIYIDVSSVEQNTGKIFGKKDITGVDAPSRARRKMHKNDIVFSAVRPNLKKCFIVDEKLDGNVCSTGFTIFRIRNDGYDPKFLKYQLLSNFFINQCMEVVTGGHYPAINDKNMKNIEVISPPLPEQRRIVAYFDSLQTKVDELKELQAETEKELEELVPSILDKAFKGEL